VPGGWRRLAVRLESTGWFTCRPSAPPTTPPPPSSVPRSPPISFFFFHSHLQLETLNFRSLSIYYYYYYYLFHFSPRLLHHLVSIRLKARRLSRRNSLMSQSFAPALFLEPRIASSPELPVWPFRPFWFFSSFSSFWPPLCPDLNMIPALYGNPVVRNGQQVIQPVFVSAALIWSDSDSDSQTPFGDWFSVNWTLTGDWCCSRIDQHCEGDWNSWQDLWVCGVRFFLIFLFSCLFSCLFPWKNSCALFFFLFY